MWMHGPGSCLSWQVFSFFLVETLNAWNLVELHGKIVSEHIHQAILGVRDIGRYLERSQESRHVV